MTISKTERRWHEGLGERYTADGRIRCQCVAKGKLRQIRFERNDPDIRPDDVWPEAQCTRAAIEGAFACTYHGGHTPNSRRVISDFMPLDLQEKFKVFESHPDLMNRYVELAQIQARNAQLFEYMEEMTVAPESYGLIELGLEQVKAGEIAKGAAMIEAALGDLRGEQSYWDEIRKNWDVMVKLSQFQLTQEEKLKTMATLDQVRHMIDGFFRATRYVLESNLDDKVLVERCLSFLAAELRQLVGARQAIKALNDDE